MYLLRRVVLQGGVKDDGVDSASLKQSVTLRDIFTDSRTVAP